MVSIAEFQLPAAEFPLGRIFEDRPEATLELDRIVPSSDTVMPFFWVYDPQDDMAWVRDFFADLPELRGADLRSTVASRDCSMPSGSPSTSVLWRPSASRT